MFLSVFRLFAVVFPIYIRELILQKHMIYGEVAVFRYIECDECHILFAHICSSPAFLSTPLQ